MRLKQVFLHPVGKRKFWTMFTLIILAFGVVNSEEWGAFSKREVVVSVVVALFWGTLLGWGWARWAIINEGKGRAR